MRLLIQEVSACLFMSALSNHSIKIIYLVYSCRQSFADELRQTVREEMEKNRVCSDKQKLRFLISEGMRRLKELQEMLDMAGTSPYC